MRIQVGPFQLDYDSDYGIDHHSGWSVAWRGSYYVQFMSSPISAIVKAAGIIWSDYRWQKQNTM